MNSVSDIVSLKNYLGKNPDSLMFARVADAHLDKQEVDEAVTICEAGIKKHPYYVTGHFILGKCYLAKGLFEQAEKEFKRVILFDSKYITAHKCYGDVMKKIGWENTCAMSYKKIVQIDPLDDIARDMAREYLDEDEPEAIDGAETVGAAEEPAEAIAPMPVTPEEEELMFENDTLVEEVKTVTSEKDLAPTEGTPETQAPEHQLDDEKAEEFSTILDDIFNDDIVTDDEDTSTSVTSHQDQSEEQELPETVLTDLGLNEAEEDTFPFVADVPEKEKPVGDLGQTRIEEPFEFAEHLPAAPEPKSFFGKKQRGKIVTPTLGEIYAAQGQYSKAIDVFETLQKKQPDNEFYSNKIEELKQKLSETKDASKG